MRLGFTLVEVLVALAIFAMLSMAGAAMLSFTVDNQAAVGGRLERLADFERARALLATDLTQVANRPAVTEAGVAQPAFQARAGAGDGLVFAFVRRGWENPDGARRASLQYVEYDIAQGALRRRFRPMVDGAPASEPRILLTGISSYTLATFDGVAWRPVGPLEGGAPPKAVRIEIVTDAHGSIVQDFLLPGA